MLKNPKILVAGATGQVAGPIAEALNAFNEVQAAAQFSDAGAKAELEQQGINTVYFSMGDDDLSALPNVDYVFHCGCNTDPKTPDIGIGQNAEGTGFLMARYKDAKAFFHMCSSLVYIIPADPKQAIGEDAMSLTSSLPNRGMRG